MILNSRSSGLHVLIAEITGMIFVCLFFKTGFLSVALSILEVANRPGWPQTVDRLLLPPQVLGLKAFATTAQLNSFFETGSELAL